MPNNKPVCALCNTTFEPETKKVKVLNKICNAKSWKCPKCGNKITIGFGF